MSPTSYQAAPPRVTILRELFRLRNFTGHSQKIYQVLYAVPSNREVNPELECTSTIPVVT